MVTREVIWCGQSVNDHMGLLGQGVNWIHLNELPIIRNIIACV